jgi:cell division protein FtsN
VGIETSIQSTTLPNNEMVHRVRVGPFSDVEEVNRIRSLLKQNGVDAILVKEKSE